MRQIPSIIVNFAAMKGILPAIIIFLLLTGCAKSRNVIPNDGMVDSLNRLSWELQGREDITVDSFRNLQRMAVDLLREGHHSDNPVEVLGQMGFFHSITGDYITALSYLQEAADTLRNHPELSDSEGAIQLYGDMGSLYTKTGMYEEALKSNHKGITVSRRLGGRLMSDLLRMRATTFVSMGFPDSAMACYATAHRWIDNGMVNARRGYLHSIVDYEKADVIIEHPDRYADSLQWAERRLREIIDTLKAGGNDSSNARFALGKVMSLLGDGKNGIGIMENVRDEWENEGDDEGVAYATEILMHAYCRHGMTDQLAASFPVYDALRDTILNREKLNAIAMAEAKYRYRIQQSENDMLSARLELNRRTTVLLWVSLGLAMAVILFVLQRIRTSRRHRLTLERQLHDMLAHQRHLNTEIERMNSLNERDSKIRQNATPSHVDEVKRTLNPSVLSGEAERDFRRSFAALHPHFLSGLRSECPELTSNDELVCMLILLNMSTDEIAMSLGISRPSVNSARYRIRKRLHLDKDTDLDTFIKSRIRQ